MWHLLKNGFQRLLPQPCLLCGQANNRSLCGECERSLPRLDRHRWRCAQCSIPLPSDAPLCGHCVRQPPAFTQCCIPYEYSHPLDFLIHQFKYRRQLSSGKQLAQLLLQHCQQVTRPDFVVPVPMHWRKRWQRGFNQSELLAYPIAHGLTLPIVNALQRRQHGHSQKGLSRRERQSNLRRAFEIAPQYRPLLQGAHVALIDDVVTTTATARCLSELLIKAGAARVDVWALARTPDH